MKPFVKASARAEVWRPVRTRGSRRMPREGIDCFWVVTWRNDAQRALNAARAEMSRAEIYFEGAAYYAGEGEWFAAQCDLETAFRAVEQARWWRREAKRCARAALTGCID